MQLFNVWVEPLVEVTVKLSDRKDAVVIEVQWTSLYHTSLFCADGCQAKLLRKQKA